MVLIMRENGTLRLSKDMVEGTKYGVMEAFTRGIGNMIRQMDEEGLFMRMETSTKGLG